MGEKVSFGKLNIQSSTLAANDKRQVYIIKSCWAARAKHHLYVGTVNPNGYHIYTYLGLRT